MIEIIYFITYYIYIYIMTLGFITAFKIARQWNNIFKHQSKCDFQPRIP